MIDIAIPGDVRLFEKELEKIDKYKPLKDLIVISGDCNPDYCWNTGSDNNSV